MAEHIFSSVGASGRDLRGDVVTFQCLLTQPGLNPGKLDRICGSRTVNAIIGFQSRFLFRPDRRVDSNGDTLMYLNEST